MAKMCPNTNTTEWKQSVNILTEKGAIKSWLKNEDIIDPKISLYQNYLEEDFNNALNLLDEYTDDISKSNLTNNTPSRVIIENANPLIFNDNQFLTYVNKNVVKELGLEESDVNPIIPVEVLNVLYDAVRLSEKERNSNLKKIEKEIDDVNENSLFGILKKEYKNNPIYPNTIDVVMKFLENIGVETRLVNSILNEDGNVVKSALAVANFMNGSVDVINDIEKRGKAWDKVPEEAAHFFYRLLKDNAPLKKELWESAKRSDKLEQLLKSSVYNKAYDIGTDVYENSSVLLDMLTEEAIGQLIADAISRVQNKNAATPEDYSFFKALIEWFKEIFSVWSKLSPELKDESNRVWDDAARRILSSDLTDLMTFDEYYAANEESLTMIPSYASINDINNLDIITDEQKAILTFDKHFKKRTRYLKKTYSDIFKMGVRDKASWGRAYINKNDFREKQERELKKLVKGYDKKDVVVDLSKQYRTNFINKSPVLRSSEEFLKKYGDIDISLSQPLKIKGYPKLDLQIYNKVLDLIKNENPDIKSIKGKDLLKEVDVYLNANYLLNFRDENMYLDYGVAGTFEYQDSKVQTPQTVSQERLAYLSTLTDQDLAALPAEERRQAREDLILATNHQNINKTFIINKDFLTGSVQHSKVSMFFNNTANVTTKRSNTHFSMGVNDIDSGRNFSVIPTAFGNLTYYYSSNTSSIKDAAVIHEIQSDNIEFYLKLLSTIDLINDDKEKIKKGNEITNNIIDELKSLEARALRESLSIKEFSITSERRNNHMLLQQKPTTVQRIVNEVVLKEYTNKYMSFADVIDNMGDIDSKINRTAYASIDDKEIARIDEKIKSVKDSIKSYTDFYENFIEIVDGKFNSDYSNDLISEIKNKLTQEMEYTRKSPLELYEDDLTLNYRYSARGIFQSIKQRGGIFKILPESLVTRYNTLKERDNFFTYNPERAFHARDTYKEFSEDVFDFINSEYNFDVGEMPASLPNKHKLFMKNNKNDIVWMITHSLFSPVYKPRTRNTELQTNQKVINLLKSNKLIDGTNTLILSSKSTLSKHFHDSKIISSIENFIKYVDDATLKNYIKNIGYNNAILDLNSLKILVDNLDKFKLLLEDKEVTSHQAKQIEEIKYEVTMTKKRLKADLEDFNEKSDDTKSDKKEIKEIANRELSYFRPLVNELIQRHINNVGKDVPLYFSGFEMASLLQTNTNSALIYAGPNEVVQLVAFESFENEGDKYTAFLENGKDKEPVYKINDEPIAKKAYTKKYKQVKQDKVNNILKTIFYKLESSEPEFTDYYNKILTNRDSQITQNNIEDETFVVTETRLGNTDAFLRDNEPLIVDINKTFKAWKNDPTITNAIRDKRIKKYNNELFRQTNDKPLVVGPLFTAINDMPGVKLKWVSNVDGFKNDAGGYLIDLSDYHYKAAMLYGLDAEQSMSIEKDSTDAIITPVNMSESGQKTARANEIVYKLASKLSKSTGIPFVIVTKEEATEMLANSQSPYNDDNAFFFDGKVYLVGDTVSLEDVLHEYAHPLVRSIGVQNPKLFNKIFEDLSNTQDGLKIIEEVTKLFGEDYEFLKEEVIVRALTEKSKLDSQNVQPKSVFQKIIDKIIYAIKSVLRSAFKGSKININDLSPSTTLSELAKMLESKDFNIDIDIVTDSDIAVFNRQTKEYVNDLKNVKNNDLIKITNNFYDTIRNQMFQLRKDNYSELREILSPSRDKGFLPYMQKSLSKYQTINIENAETYAQKFNEDLNYQQQHSEALITNVLQVKLMLEKMIDQLHDLSKDPNNKQNLQRAFYYGKVLNHWEKFYNDSLSIINDIERGLARTEFGKILDSINQEIQSGKKMMTNIRVQGVKDALYEKIKPLMDNVKDKYEQKVEIIKKSNRSDKLKKNRLRELKEEFDNAYLTPEKFEKMLKGELGDAHYLNGFLEGYMYNQDPVVASLAKYVKDNYNEMLAEVQKVANDFAKDIEADIKRSNISKDPAAIGKEVLFTDTVMVRNSETEELEEKEIWSILNPFKGDRKAESEYKEEIEKAKKIAFETSDHTALIQAVNNFRIFKNNYYHRPYAKIFYDRQKIFDTTEGQKAFYARQLIYEKMDNIRRRSGSELERLQSIDDIKPLLYDLRQLSSLVDLNGNKKKSGKENPELKLEAKDDLDVAFILREYSENSRRFFEYEEIPNLFNERYLGFVEELKMKGITEENTPNEFEKEEEKWLEHNTRKAIKQEFYDTRADIFSRLEELIKQLPKDTAEKIDRTEITADIYDALSPYKDTDGQPVGTEMTEKMIAYIKSLQETLNKIKDEELTVSGLTKAEKEELNNLWDLWKNDRDYMTSVDLDRFNFLNNKSTTQGLSKAQKSEFYSLLGELDTLQSKIPTEYYLDIFNNYLSKLDTSSINIPGFNGAVNSFNIIDVIGKRSIINSLLNQDKEFKTWFNKNHIDRTIKVKGKTRKIYDIVYAWSKVIPNDKSYYEQTNITNSEGIVIKTIELLPAYEYFDRNVKDTYLDDFGREVKLTTDKIVGETIDNRGRWLPKEGKDLEAGIPDRFRNDEYFRIKREDPTRFDLIEKVKKWMLIFQEDAEDKSKLYLDSPRFRRTNLEYLQSGEARKEKVSQWASIKKGIKDLFTSSEDDAEEGYNFDDDSNLEIAHLDLIDDDVNIPINGLYSIPSDQVSLDLVQGMYRYMQSIKKQNKLVEMNPVAESLKNITSDPENALKDVVRIEKENMLNRAIKKVKFKKGKYIRENIINNFYEREFEGKTLTGVGSDNNAVNKIAGLIMSRASFAFFALNMPSALKNRYGAMFQIMIESSGSDHINPLSLAKGRAWSAGAAVELMAQVYTRGPKSHNLQLIELFDFIQGRFEEKIGNSSSRSVISDAANMKWLYSPRKMMEVEASLQLAGGMMYKQKVKLNNGTEISLIDAYETIDGQIRLKDEVTDREWEAGKSKFNAFKNTQQQVSNNLQGAYAKFDQPEAQRYIAFRAFSFLRRYFTPMMVNRYAFRGKIWNPEERYDIATDNMTMGYYMRSLKWAGKVLKSGGQELMYMTPQERSAGIKVLTELALLYSLPLLASLLFGWDGDDPDRFSKLRQREKTAWGWTQNHMLFQLMAVRAENEQFIPLPAYGLGDILGFKDVTSVVFGPTLDTYGKVLIDLHNTWFGDDGNHYKVDIGPHPWQKKGSNKIWNHTGKAFGVSGKDRSPAQMIKDFDSFRQRYK